MSKTSSNKQAAVVALVLLAGVCLCSVQSTEAMSPLSRSLLQTFQQFPHITNQLTLNVIGNFSIGACEWRYYTFTVPANFNTGSRTESSLEFLIRSKGTVDGTLNAMVTRDTFPTMMMNNVQVSASSTTATPIGVVTCNVTTGTTFVVAVQYSVNSNTAATVNFELTVRSNPMSFAALAQGTRSGMLTNQSATPFPAGDPGANIRQYIVTTPSDLGLGESMLITVSTQVPSTLSTTNQFPFFTGSDMEIWINQGDSAGPDASLPGGCSDIPLTLKDRVNTTYAIFEVSNCVLTASTQYFIGVRRANGRVAITNYTISLTYDNSIRGIPTLSSNPIQGDVLNSVSFKGNRVAHYRVQPSQFLTVEVFNVVGGTVNVYIAKGGLAGTITPCAPNLNNCTVTSGGSSGHYPSCTFNLGFAQIETPWADPTDCQNDFNEQYFVAVEGVTYNDIARPVTFEIIGVASPTTPVALSSGDLKIASIVENEFHFYEFTVPSTVTGTQVLNFDLYADLYDGGNNLAVYYRMDAPTIAGGVAAGPYPCLTNDFNTTVEKAWVYNVPACLVVPGAKFFVSFRNAGVTNAQNSYYNNPIRYTFSATLQDAMPLMNATTVSNTIGGVENSGYNTGFYQHYVIEVPTGFDTPFINESARLDIELVNENPMTNLSWWVNFGSLAGTQDTSECCYKNLYGGFERQYFRSPEMYPTCFHVKPGKYYVSVYLPGASALTSNHGSLATGYTLTATIRSSPYPFQAVFSGEYLYNEWVDDMRYRFYAASGTSSQNVEMDQITVTAWNIRGAVNDALTVYSNRFTPAENWCFDQQNVVTNTNYNFSIYDCNVTCGNYFFGVIGAAKDYYVPIYYNFDVRLSGPNITLLNLTTTFFEVGGDNSSYYKVQIGANDISGNGTFLKVRLSNIKYGNASVYVTRGGLAGPRFESCRPTMAFCANDRFTPNVRAVFCEAVLDSCNLTPGTWYITVVKRKDPSANSMSDQQVAYGITASLLPGTSTIQTALQSGQQRVETILMNEYKFYQLPKISSGFQFLTIETYMDTLSRLEEPAAGIDVFIVKQNGSTFEPLVCGSDFTNDTAMTNVDGFTNTFINASAVMLGSYSVQETIQLCGAALQDTYYLGIVGRNPRNQWNQTQLDFGVPARFTLTTTLAGPAPLTLNNGYATVTTTIRPGQWKHYQLDLSSATVSGRYLRISTNNVQNSMVRMFLTRSPDVTSCLDPLCQAVQQMTCSATSATNGRCWMVLDTCKLEQIVYYISLWAESAPVALTPLGVELQVALNGSVTALTNSVPFNDSIDVNQYKNYALTQTFAANTATVVSISNVRWGNVTVRASVNGATGPTCLSVATCSTGFNQSHCEFLLNPCFVDGSSSLFISVEGTTQQDNAVPIMYMLTVSTRTAISLTNNVLTNATIPMGGVTTVFGFTLPSSTVSLSSFSLQLINQGFNNQSADLSTGLSALVGDLQGPCTFGRFTGACTTATTDGAECLDSSSRVVVYPSRSLTATRCVGDITTFYLAVTASAIDSMKDIINFQVRINTATPSQFTLASTSTVPPVNAQTLSGVVSTRGAGQVFVIPSVLSAQDVSYSLSTVSGLGVRTFFRSTGAACPTACSFSTTGTQFCDITPCDTAAGAYSIYVFRDSTTLSGGNVTFTITAQVRPVSTISADVNSAFQLSSWVTSNRYNQYTYAPSTTTTVNGQNVPSVYQLAFSGSSVSAYYRVGGRPATAASCCNDASIGSSTILNACQLQTSNNVNFGVTTTGSNNTYSLSSTNLSPVSIPAATSTSVPANTYGFATISLPVGSTLTTAILKVTGNGAVVRISPTSFLDALCTTTALAQCSVSGSSTVGSTASYYKLFTGSDSTVSSLFVVFSNPTASSVSVTWSTFSNNAVAQASLDASANAASVVSVSSAQQLVFNNVANVTRFTLNGGSAVPPGSKVEYLVNNQASSAVCTGLTSTFNDNGDAVLSTSNAVCGFSCTGATTVNANTASNPILVGEICDPFTSNQVDVAVQSTSTSTGELSSFLSYTTTLRVTKAQQSTLSLQTDFYNRQRVSGTVNSTTSFFYAINNIGSLPSGTNVFAVLEDASGSVSVSFTGSGSCSIGTPCTATSSQPCFASLNYCGLSAAQAAGQGFGVLVKTTSASNLAFNVSVFSVAPLSITDMDSQVGFVFPGTYQTYILSSFSQSLVNSLNVNVSTVSTCGSASLMANNGESSCFSSFGTEMNLDHCASRPGMYYFTVTGALNTGSQNYQAPITYNIRTGTWVPRVVNAAPYEWVRWVPGTVLRVIDDPSTFNGMMVFDVMGHGSDCTDDDLMVSNANVNHFASAPQNITDFCTGSGVTLGECDFGTPGNPMVKKCLGPCSNSANTYDLAFGNTCNPGQYGVLVRARYWQPYTTPINSSTPFVWFNRNITVGTYNHYVVTLDNVDDTTELFVSINTSKVAMNIRTDQDSNGIMTFGNGVQCAPSFTTPRQFHIPNCALVHARRTTVYISIFGSQNFENMTWPYQLNVTTRNATFTQLTSGKPFCDQVRMRNFYKLPISTFTETNFLTVKVDNVVKMIGDSRVLNTYIGSMLLPMNGATCNNGSLSLSDGGSGTIWNACYDAELGALIIGVYASGDWTTDVTFSYRITATLNTASVTDLTVANPTAVKSFVAGGNRVYFRVPSSALAETLSAGNAFGLNFFQIGSSSPLVVTAAIGHVPLFSGSGCSLAGQTTITGTGTFSFNGEQFSCSQLQSGNVILMVTPQNATSAGSYFTISPSVTATTPTSLTAGQTANAVIPKGQSGAVYRIGLPSSVGQRLGVTVTGKDTFTVSFIEFSGATTPYVCGVRTTTDVTAVNGTFWYDPCLTTQTGGSGGFIEIRVYRSSASNGQCVYSLTPNYMALNLTTLTAMTPMMVDNSANSELYYQFSVSNVHQGPVVVYVYGVQSGTTVTMRVSGDRVPVNTNLNCTSNLMVTPYSSSNLNSTERAYLVYGCGSTATTYYMSLSVTSGTYYVMYANPAVVSSTSSVQSPSNMPQFFLNVYQLEAGVGSVRTAITSQSPTALVGQYDSIAPLYLKLGRISASQCGRWDAQYMQECEPFATGTECFNELPTIAGTGNSPASLLLVDGRGPYQYTLNAGFASSNCKTLSTGDFALSQCPSVSSTYSTWTPINTTEHEVWAQGLFEYWWKPAQCRNPLCVEALQRLSCFTSFRQCEAVTGYVHGVCRDVCWQAQDLCGYDWNVLQCASNTIWDDSASCTGTPMNVPTAEIAQCPTDKQNNITCGGHGTCEDGRCICDCGWVGFACDRAACPSAPNPFTGAEEECGGQGACDFSGSQPVCVCNLQFEGPTCTEPRPQCPVANNMTCNGEGNCIFSPRGNDTSRFTAACNCSVPFTGSACADFACSRGLENKVCSGPSRGECIALNGAPFCDCNPSNLPFGGFYGSACQNSNCTLTGDVLPCSGNGDCEILANGTFACSCNAAFTGGNCERSVCKSANGEICNKVEAVGAFCNPATGRCDCGDSGFGGETCSAPLCPVVNGEICAGNGNCVRKQGSSNFGCECNGVFTGSSCTEIGNCANAANLTTSGGICHGNGEPVFVDGSNTECRCVCGFGFAGATCQVDRFPNCTTSEEKVCNNQGVCNVDIGTNGTVAKAFCACNNTWFGDKCEFSKCNGQRTECNGGGTCLFLPDEAVPTPLPSPGAGHGFTNYKCECRRADGFLPEENGGCRRGATPTPNLTVKVDLVVEIAVQPKFGTLGPIPNATIVGNRFRWLVRYTRNPNACNGATTRFIQDQFLFRVQQDLVLGGDPTSPVLSPGSFINVTIDCGTRRRALLQSNPDVPRSFGSRCTVPAGDTTTTCTLSADMSEVAQEDICQNTRCCHNGKICNNRGRCLNNIGLDYCECDDSSDAQPNCRDGLGIIIGGAVGGIVGVALIAGLLYYFLVVKKRPTAGNISTGGRSYGGATSTPALDTPTPTGADTMKSNPLYGI